MDILDILKLGEGKTVEFKQILPKSENLAKTIVAFSNTAGGKVFIGITDEKEIVGVSEHDISEVYDKISNMIADTCYPLIVPEISTAFINDRNIIVITVYSGSQKPYYLKSKGRDLGTYIRIGATNKQADNNSLAELERQRLNIAFDEEVVLDVNVEEINLEKLKSDFYKHTGRDLTLASMENLKLLVNKNGQKYPSRGLLLLLGNEKFFEYSKIKCARFKGRNVVDFLDMKEYTGSLYEMIENAIIFLKNHLNISAVINGLKRQEILEIPESALREAILNAVVHRDYSISGSNIKIEVFDNRVEISSPGGLPRTLTIEDIKAGRSEIRNFVIARVIKEMGFIEQWGSGIRRMIQLCRENEISEPEFFEDGQHFRVVFYRKEIDTDKRNVSTDKSTNSTDKNNLSTEKNKVEKEIVNFIKENGRIRNKDVAKIMRITGDGAKKVLEKLVKREVLIPIGKKKGRYYLLK